VEKAAPRANNMPGAADAPNTFTPDNCANDFARANMTWFIANLL